MHFQSTDSIDLYTVSLLTYYQN